jgi:hypothetical protein
MYFSFHTVFHLLYSVFYQYIHTYIHTQTHTHTHTHTKHHAFQYNCNIIRHASVPVAANTVQFKTIPMFTDKYYFNMNII